jgi:hypothetical protein
MKWLLAAAIVVIALTYCIEATVDGNANIISSSQDSSKISAIKSIINNREAANQKANSSDLTAQPSNELNIDSSQNLLRERSDANLNFINNPKNSLNAIRVFDGRDLVASPDAASDIDSKLGYLLGNSPSYQNNTDQLLIANSNVGLSTNSKLGYVYENSQANKGVKKGLVASTDISSNINTKLGYLLGNSPSDQDNTDQLLIANSNVGLSTNSEIGYAYENSRANNGAKKGLVASTDISSNINTKLGYLSENNQLDEDVKGAIVAGSNIASSINSKMGYLYENGRPDENLRNKVPIASSNPSSDTGSKISYLYHTANYRNDNRAPEKTLSTLGIASLIKSNLDRICIQTDPSYNSRSDELLVKNWLGNVGFYPFESGISHSNASINLPMRWDKKSNSHKNYAVVVGINGYDDRKGLHASVNDANYLGSILKSLGYEVITLTDGAEIKPTKHNILEGALKEISLKKNRGNVVLYFSGHGEVDSKGNFYIIPQDGNGDMSSYISENEINQYLKGMKNLAIVIDACNSGAFKVAADEDQLILTSSNENEPSNENWTAPVSVFTYYLCQSIEEENKINKEIIMQKAFSRAYNDTLMWSSNHLVRQTPCLVDTTNGQYYLN